MLAWGILEQIYQAHFGYKRRALTELSQLIQLLVKKPVSKRKMDWVERAPESGAIFEQARMGHYQSGEGAGKAEATNPIMMQGTVERS